MRHPLVSVTDGTRRPSGTVVREWHRLACCASATSKSGELSAAPGHAATS